MAASAPARPMAPSRKGSSMRPPSAPRPGVNRAQTATPTLNGRATPTDSMSARQRTPKRKAPVDLLESMGGEETNINVVVRCRGRNDRELRENSAVAVSSDGIKGKKVELSMGPNAISNKAYQFDKVFSPAADQGMIFDEVVVPILDEVLAGFNCTIFAYGQTGTGKTYTMSGDITDILPIPEAAGIIPRVLHSLFDKLNADEKNKPDTTVKCSFIELYNEELRDLLAFDDNAKLKIFDDANKNGRTTTMVQGMEETHIESASRGIQLLCEGSHKRQVAATKCNDLSSRSHTVFSMTIYTKRFSESGEEHISASKLNLVDLAGSENIQRSGAENKRATEAGLINKSLLTLGRVINALVDRSSHIPYRESKLTRLLQDSLGGRTKTCIIATLSPAKSNLEETISTLDYAFRAKNIRNKPQMNQLVSKKTLIREFTSEIEKLKSELIATRHRNGYYLTAEAYEELTTQSESRRILSEEQRDKIGTMESNLRNKVQELFNLTNSFQSMKKDNDNIRCKLDSTELVLDHTKRSLAEETCLRKAHAETEMRLAATSEDMRSTLRMTTQHIDKLHDKLDLRSSLHDNNRSKWIDAEGVVIASADVLDNQLSHIHKEQSGMLVALSDRIGLFVTAEIAAIQASQSSLESCNKAIAASQLEIQTQQTTAQSGMDQVLDEVCTLREDVKAKVGSGLDVLAGTAQRISAGIARELGELDEHLQDIKMALGREFTTMFDDIISRFKDQQAEINRLRKQNDEAQTAYSLVSEEARLQLQQRIDDERVASHIERTELLSKIGTLIQDVSSKQERRLASHVEHANKRIKTSESEYSIVSHAYGQGMDAWDLNATVLAGSVVQSKQLAHDRLKEEWKGASNLVAQLTETTDAVHMETVNAIDDQMQHMDTQLASLDDIVSRVQLHNEEHQLVYASSLARMANTVQQGYRDVKTQYSESADRIGRFSSAQDYDPISMLECLQAGHESVETIRKAIDAGQIDDYTTKGDTPARTHYPMLEVLPGGVVDAMRGQYNMKYESPSGSPNTPKRSPTKRTLKRGLSPTKIPSSPSKTHVFIDTRTASQDQPLITLREIDANIKSTFVCIEQEQKVISKRMAAGRENVMPIDLPSVRPGRTLRSRSQQ